MNKIKLLSLVAFFCCNLFWAGTLLALTDRSDAGSDVNVPTGTGKVKETAEPALDTRETNYSTATVRARTFLGKYYSEFDCSELTRQIYPELPRTAQQQFNYFKNRDKIIDLKDDLQEGDLMFFKNPDGIVKHVGYVESNNNGKITMIHSSQYKRRIVETMPKINDENRAYNIGRGLYFCGGGRILGSNLKN
jgi:cell wall-associated NlpC family hydrolase